VSLTKTSLPFSNLLVRHDPFARFPVQKPAGFEERTSFQPPCHPTSFLLRIFRFCIFREEDLRWSFEHNSAGGYISPGLSASVQLFFFFRDPCADWRVPQRFFNKVLRSPGNPLPRRAFFSSRFLVPPKSEKRNTSPRLDCGLTDIAQCDSDFHLTFQSYLLFFVRVDEAALFSKHRKSKPTSSILDV